MPSSKGKRTERISKYTSGTLNHTTREWRGGEKYARVSVIGKGAFATVYKVTSRYDGSPYAAKELDKRKFMKNGVLDQKVENEMRIMQNVQHVSFSLRLIIDTLDIWSDGGHRPILSNISSILIGTPTNSLSLWSTFHWAIWASLC